MICEVGRRLAEAFSLSAREYANTAASLGRLSAILDSSELLMAEEETLGRARETLRKAEAARVAFEAHLDQHRHSECLVSPSGREQSSD